MLSNVLLILEIAGKSLANFYFMGTIRKKEKNITIYTFNSITSQLQTQGRDIFLQDFGRFPFCEMDTEREVSGRRKQIILFKNLFSLPMLLACNAQWTKLWMVTPFPHKKTSWARPAANFSKWLNSRALTVVDWNSKNVISCLSTTDWCIFKSKSKQLHPLFKHQGNQMRLVFQGFGVNGSSLSPSFSFSLTRVGERRKNCIKM